MKNFPRNSRFYCKSNGKKLRFGSPTNFLFCGIWNEHEMAAVQPIVCERYNFEKRRKQKTFESRNSQTYAQESHGTHKKGASVYF